MTQNSRDQVYIGEVIEAAASGRQEMSQYREFPWEFHEDGK